MQAEREHLLHCPQCQKQIARLAGEILGEEALHFLEFIYLEDMGRLKTPPSYPEFNLSFLTPSSPPISQPQIWRTAGLPLPGGAGRQIRQLAEGIELRINIYKRKMDASFEGLTGWLSSSVMPARAPVVAPVWRGGQKKRTGKGQVLSLPDPEGNLEITLAVQAAHRGKSHLKIEVSEAESGRPLERVRINLRHATGSQALHTRAGKAVFYELAPDRYTIEVKPVGKGEVSQEWHFDITLESI